MVAEQTEAKKGRAKTAPVEDTILHGMDAICEVARRSDTTILRWVREKDFPAVKEGGVWISDRVKIQEWYKARIEKRAAS